MDLLQVLQGYRSPSEAGQTLRATSSAIQKFCLNGFISDHIIWPLWPLPQSGDLRNVTLNGTADIPNGLCEPRLTTLTQKCEWPYWPDIGYITFLPSRQHPSQPSYSIVHINEWPSLFHKYRGMPFNTFIRLDIVTFWEKGQDKRQELYPGHEPKPEK